MYVCLLARIKPSYLIYPRCSVSQLSVLIDLHTISICLSLLEENIAKSMEVAREKSNLDNVTEENIINAEYRET